MVPQSIDARPRREPNWMRCVLTIRARIAPAQRDLRLGLAWFRPVGIGYVEFGIDKWLEIWDTCASTILAISLVSRMVLATQGNPYPWMVVLVQGAPNLRLPDPRLAGPVSRPRCQPRGFEAEETACGLVVLDWGRSSVFCGPVIVCLARA